jgi:hypothetical protein
MAARDHKNNRLRRRPQKKPASHVRKRAAEGMTHSAMTKITAMTWLHFGYLNDPKRWRLRATEAQAHVGKITDPEAKRSCSKSSIVMRSWRGVPKMVSSGTKGQRPDDEPRRLGRLSRCLDAG